MSISINICSISAILLENVTHYVPEGSISQHVDLGPGYIEILNNYCGTIIHILSNKNVTRT